MVTIDSKHYVKLYPQNGDRIVTIDSVVSDHPMYTANDVSCSRMSTMSHVLNAMH